MAGISKMSFKGRAQASLALVVIKIKQLVIILAGHVNANLSHLFFANTPSLNMSCKGIDIYMGLFPVLN